MSIENPQVSILKEICRTKDIEARSASKRIVGRASATIETFTKEAWVPGLVNGNERLTDNLECAHVIGIDYDKGFHLSTVIELMKPYACIIGTTITHLKPKPKDNGEVEPPCDRFRVIVFLDKPVHTNDDYKATFHYIVARYGLPVAFDRSATDAVRWFTPCVTVAFSNITGSLTKAQTAPPRPKKKISDENMLAGVKGRLSHATLSFIARQPSELSWHDRFIRAAADFMEQGYSPEEASVELAKASPEGCLDNTDFYQLESVYYGFDRYNDLRFDWPEVCFNQRTGTYSPVSSSTANLEYLLTNIIGVSFALNSRSDIIEIVRRDGSRSKIKDSDRAVFATKARSYKLDGGIILTDLISSIASENAYDPLMDFFKDLKWDGVPRIRELLSTISFPDDCLEDEAEWNYLMLRRWLIGLVGKFYSQNVQNLVLVINGPQGIGKSRWFKRIVCGLIDYWGEGGIDPDKADHVVRHVDKLIWCISELDATTGRKDVAALKDYLTQSNISVRRPYRRDPISERSICSFCASGNSTLFLHDETGNRRFWVIRARNVNPDHSIDTLQVLAEAKAAFQAGEQYYFTQEEEQIREQLNERFISRDDVVDLLSQRAQAGDDWLSLPRIISALGIVDYKLTHAIRDKMTALLMKRKIESRNSRRTGLQYKLNLKQLCKPTKTEQVDHLRIINNDNLNKEADQ